MSARAATLIAAIALAGHAAAADWLQFGYDAAHGGVNPLETTLGRDNAASLVEIRVVPTSDPVLGSPTYLSGVATPGGTKNLLFVTAQSGALLALDAASGAVVWSHQPPNLGTPYSLTQSSPAIDADRQFLYGYGLDGNVHRYAVADGAETLDQGWPQVVTAKPDVEHVAAALTFAHTGGASDYLYVVSDGYVGDGGDYQGHLTTINLGGAQQTIFNALCSNVFVHFLENGTPGVTDCDSVRAGIWGRPGATYDSVSGRVYIATGNGPYDADIGGFDWGDSVVALPAHGYAAMGTPLDSYTPANYHDLDLYDVDLGSSSPAIIGDVPGVVDGRLGAIIGKDGIVRLLALDDLSGAGGPRHVGGELAATQGGFSKCNTPQPAVRRAADGSVWLYAITGPILSAYRIVADTSGHPALELHWTAEAATSPVIANDVLYVVAGSLVARDADTGEVLWQSADALDVKWQSPIVVDGRVYVAAYDGLHVYGLDRVFADGFGD